jgi:hypothetical protein
MRLILSFLSHGPARSSTLHAGLQSCFPILFEPLRRKPPNFGKRGKPHRSIYCGDDGPLWAVSDISEFMRLKDAAVVDLVDLGPKLTINTRRA